MKLHLTGVQMLTNTSFEALIEISPFLGHILVLTISLLCPFYLVLSSRMTICCYCYLKEFSPQHVVDKRWIKTQRYNQKYSGHIALKWIT